MSVALPCKKFAGGCVLGGPQNEALESRRRAATWCGRGAGETWGVALYDETGKRCVTFRYPKETDAKAGREHIKAALMGVASVTKVQDNDR
jgi:hypothetical protein